MGLIDRVTALFRRGGDSSRSGAQNDKPGRTTSDELAPRGTSPLDLAGELRATSDRRGKIRACREMYEGDTRGQGVIGALARDMVRGGFEVEVLEAASGRGDEAEEIAGSLAERLGLGQRLDDWLRYVLKDGDLFLELGVDEQLDIALVTRKPTLEVRRNSNKMDRFDDPRQAFWQGEEWAQEPGRDAIWFAEWQMIHARWQHDEGSRYGTPLFGAAVKPFKRMTEGETDVAVRRKTRAGMKFVHKFPDGTDRNTIEEYREINQDSLRNPLAAIADFFGTVDVKAVQGDGQLGEIEDVMHHIRTWFLASPVAMSLLGYGQDLNRDVLDAQQEQYLRALEALTAFPETEIIKPLLERQWLLKGIYPASLKYELRWKSKQVLSAAAVSQAADAGLKLKAIGAPAEVVQRVLAALLPAVDLGEWERGAGEGERGRAGERESGRGGEGGRASAGRLAAIASELGQ